MAIASASGKIMWIGSYAVLERPCVSYVTGVDKRVFVTAQHRDDGRVAISAKQFNAFFDGSLADGKVTPNTTDENTLKATKFVRKAIEVSLAYLAGKGASANGLNVTTRSDPEFGFGASKAGLGSSAAVTVATVAAVFEELGFPIKDNLEAIHKCGQVSHSLVQGKVGSGFDVAAACYGGCKYVRYSPELVKGLGEDPTPEQIAEAVEKDWDCIIEPIGIPKGFGGAVASFRDKSASTTDMVKKVNAWKAAEPEAYRALIAEIDESDKKTIAFLSDGELDDFRESFIEGRKLTKKLGSNAGTDIESDEYTALIEESEKNGAFVARLPGAGGGDSIAALCTSPKDAERLKEFWRQDGRLEVLNVSFGNEGVRVETRG